MVQVVDRPKVHERPAGSGAVVDAIGQTFTLPGFEDGGRMTLAESRAHRDQVFNGLMARLGVQASDEQGRVLKSVVPRPVTPDMFDESVRGGADAPVAWQSSDFKRGMNSAALGLIAGLFEEHVGTDIESDTLQTWILSFQKYLDKIHSARAFSGTVQEIVNAWFTQNYESLVPNKAQPASVVAESESQKIDGMALDLTKSVFSVEKRLCIDQVLTAFDQGWVRAFRNTGTLGNSFYRFAREYLTGNKAAVIDDNARVTIVSKWLDRIQAPAELRNIFEFKKVSVVRPAIAAVISGAGISKTFQSEVVGGTRSGGNSRYRHGKMAAANDDSDRD